MPGKKRPTDEDAATARRALLDGLARGADLIEVLSAGTAEFPDLTSQERKLQRAMQEPATLDAIKRGPYCLDCIL